MTTGHRGMCARAGRTSDWFCCVIWKWRTGKEVLGTVRYWTHCTVCFCRETGSGSMGSESTTQSAGARCCYAGYAVVMGYFRALNYSFVNTDKQSIKSCWDLICLESWGVLSHLKGFKDEIQESEAEFAKSSPHFVYSQCRKVQGGKVHFRDAVVMFVCWCWTFLVCNLYIHSCFFSPFLLSIQGIDISNIVQRQNSGN